MEGTRLRGPDIFKALSTWCTTAIQIRTRGLFLQGRFHLVKGDGFCPVLVVDVERQLIIE